MTTAYDLFVDLFFACIKTKLLLKFPTIFSNGFPKNFDKIIRIILHRKIYHSLKLEYYNQLIDMFHHNERVCSYLFTWISEPIDFVTSCVERSTTKSDINKRYKEYLELREDAKYRNEIDHSVRGK